MRDVLLHSLERYAATAHLPPPAPILRSYGHDPLRDMDYTKPRPEVARELPWWVGNNGLTD